MSGASIEPRVDSRDENKVFLAETPAAKSQGIQLTPTFVINKQSFGGLVFCSKCRIEYREGFYRCSDFNCDLVDKLPELPAEERPEFIEYVEVMGTYNPADVALIKSILDAENITYFFNAEHFMYVRPLAEPVRLMVKRDEVGKAKEVLQGLNLSILGIDLRKTESEIEDE